MLALCVANLTSNDYSSGYTFTCNNAFQKGVLEEHLSNIE